MGAVYVALAITIYDLIDACIFLAEPPGTKGVPASIEQRPSSLADVGLNPVGINRAGNESNHYGNAGEYDNYDE